MTLTRPAVAALLGLCFVPPAIALGQLESGPEAGSRAEPFPAFAATGELTGRPLDFVARREGRPTVFLFVQAASLDRPMARYIKALDRALAGGIEGAADAAAVGVWLTDDADESKGFLPRAQQSLRLEKTALAVFEGPRTGPDGWSLNDMAGLTAVVVREGKVVASLGYDATYDESEVRKVVRALRGS